MEDNKGWIQTFSGHKFYPLDPNPGLIDLEDLAHGLAHECRYGNHSNKFYSVADHSWMMSKYLFTVERYPDSVHDLQNLKLYALLHDSAEAYLCDIPRPVKHRPEMLFYREAEDRLLDMILDKFGIERSAEIDGLIKTADRDMLCHELADRNVRKPVHEDYEIRPTTEMLECGMHCFSPVTMKSIWFEEFVNVLHKRF